MRQVDHLRAGRAAGGAGGAGREGDAVARREEQSAARVRTTAKRPPTHLDCTVQPLSSREEFGQIHHALGALAQLHHPAVGLSHKLGFGWNGAQRDRTADQGSQLQASLRARPAQQQVPCHAPPPPPHLQL